MKEEHGRITGDYLINEPYVLWGSIFGNVRAITHAKLYVRGVIYGNLEVDRHARCHIYGNISGNLIVGRRAKVIHSGVIGGNINNRGGRLYIEAKARVLGKVVTESGETETELPPMR